MARLQKRKGPPEDQEEKGGFGGTIPRKWVVRAAVLLRHWIPEFMKQVFPRFPRPVAPFTILDLPLP